MASTFHVYFGPNTLTLSPKLRRIEPADCFAALAEGFDDALEMPTYPAFLGVFYALAGVALVSLSSFANALQLAFPLAAGFALVGPFVAVGLYEMSRRREQGLEADWRDAFAVVRSPALPSILALGVLLFAIFAAWIDAAQVLYVRLYGPDPPAAAIPFFRDVLTTSTSSARNGRPSRRRSRNARHGLRPPSPGELTGASESGCFPLRTDFISFGRSSRSRRQRAPTCLRVQKKGYLLLFFSSLFTIWTKRLRRGMGGAS